jgi:putative membrane protein
MSSQTCASTHILRGAVAGLIGGVVASWAMNQFQAATQKSAAAKPSGGGDARQQASDLSAQRQQQDGGDDATVKTAQAISRKLFDHDLTPGEKKVAGPAVHYGYGALVGGIYGAVAEVWPGISAGLGIPYAFALFVLGDETAVPALHLGPPPTQVPVKSHADYLAVHILYGIVLDVARRMARLIV